MLNTQEHADLVQMFERIYRISGANAAKEPKQYQVKGNVYCSGPVNEQFIAFRHGYAFGKSLWRGRESEGKPGTP